MNGMYSCRCCEEMLPASAFFWGKKRSPECIACKRLLGDIKRERQERRWGDLRRHLERCRRSGVTLEPWQLDELYISERNGMAVTLAKRWGFSDVLASPHEWANGRIKTGGAAAWGTGVEW